MNDASVTQNKREKIHSVIYLLLTGMVTGLYALISSLASMPYAEGWNSYFAKCMNDGQQIYRDFSYMFWPFYQDIITAITNFAGYDLFILRIIGAVLFALISMTAFLIFKKLVKPGYAMIAATCTAFYLQSEIVQVFYDYVRFMDLFAYLSILFILYAINETAIKKNEVKLKSLLFSAAAGLFTGLFTCTKQNMGILFFVFAVCLFIFFMIIYSGKQLWKSLVFYVSAYFISVLGILSLSLGNTDITTFLNLTVSGASSAKGGIFTILFSWIKNGLPTFAGQAGSVLLIFTVLLINVLSNNEKVKNWFLSLKTVSCIKNSCISFSAKLKKSYAEFLNRHSSVWTKLLDKAVKFIQTAAKLAAKYIHIEYLYFCAVIFIIIAGSANESIGTYFSENFLVNQYAVYLFDVIVFIFCAIKLIVSKAKKQEISSFYTVLCILCGAVFAIGYGCGTSGGLSQGELGFGLGVLICILLFNFRSKIGSISKIVAVSMVFVVSATCITFKYVHPYNWWGMSQPSIYECTYRTDIPLFKHIRMSEDTGKIYEEIVHNITDNTDPDDKIFCFPHIPIFYLASERDDIGTYSKVQWFDVCSDNIIDNDIEYLENNPPKAIVVYNVPDWVQASHENMFRNGQKSSMRKMGENLYDYAISNGYTYYGTYYINSDNSISLYIDDGKSHFSFYESGLGTREDPYIISTKSQLQNFAKMVDSGWTFENKFLALDKDIDLGNEEWEPIGSYKEKISFKGNLDGKGHKIKNLTISKGETSGLFEYLSGEVYNLGFEGGYIKGDVCGTIAAYSTGSIVNCYSSVTLDGDTCGGIAGKSSGTTYNCVYSGKFLNARHYNITNDMGNMITFDCYLTESSISSLDIRQISISSPNNYIISDKMLNSEFFIDILNKNLLSYQSEDNLYHRFITDSNGQLGFSKKWVMSIDKSKLYVTATEDTEDDEYSDRITVTPGAIQYGPYTTLSRGSYTITFYGENLANASYDVFSGMLDYYPEKFNINKTDTVVSFDITVTENIEDAEIRTINSQDSTVYIDNITIEGIN